MRLTRLSFSFLLATMVLATPLASTHAATSMASNLKGRILLQVEGHGEAWYVNPANQKRYYLGRPDDAFKVMRTLGVGITNENLLKIEEEGGIPNNEFVDKNFSRLHAGKIFLDIENKGRAYYVNPVNLKRYYLGSPANAFTVMRSLGLGINNRDLEMIYDFEYDFQTGATQSGSFRILDPKHGQELFTETKYYDLFNDHYSYSIEYLKLRRAGYADKVLLTLDTRENDEKNKHLNKSGTRFSASGKYVITQVIDDNTSADLYRTRVMSYLFDVNRPAIQYNNAQFIALSPDEVNVVYYRSSCNFVYADAVTLNDGGPCGDADQNIFTSSAQAFLLHQKGTILQKFEEGVGNVSIVGNITELSYPAKDIIEYYSYCNLVQDRGIHLDVGQALYHYNVKTKQETVVKLDTNRNLGQCSLLGK